MSKTAIDENKIRETAYLFWLDDGQPEGRDQEHWLKAVDALTPPTPKKRARKAPTKKAAPKAAVTKAKAPAKKTVKAKAAK